MTFMLFKLVSQHLPGASIWAIYKSTCKLFIPEPTPAPCLCLCGPSRPLSLLSCFPTASKPLLIEVIICYLLYIVNLKFRTAQRVYIGILALYMRKLTLGEVKQLP